MYSPGEMRLEAERLEEAGRSLWRHGGSLAGVKLYARAADQLRERADRADGCAVCGATAGHAPSCSRGDDPGGRFGYS